MLAELLESGDIFSARVIQLTRPRKPESLAPQLFGLAARARLRLNEPRNARTTPTGHERPGDPCTIVIFGASGDLNKRKLLPALYNLKALKLLPANFAVIGVAVSEGNDEMYRAEDHR